ncbi:MAG TPA: redox-sensing transcriptional repressor Rex [Longimicrobiales bacterium]|nr:redox-sensing transcriptional repressor Rex [Longimicrobiales bacterium]
MARLRRVVLERLIRYYRYLAELYAKQPMETVTSAKLGAALDVDASQVRKDFGAVGLSGVSRVGYQVCDVCRTIRTALGFDQAYSAVLVGVGHLGNALLNYSGFDRYGLQIVAAFDGDREKIGKQVGGHTVQSVHQLKKYIEEHGTQVAILTTPVEVAQGLADLVVDAGVKTIWNFTPTRLTVPQDVLTRNEHISVGLAQIAYHLKQTNAARRKPPAKEEGPGCCPPPPASAGVVTEVPASKKAG